MSYDFDNDSYSKYDIACAATVLGILILVADVIIAVYLYIS